MPKISIEPFLRWVAEDVAGFPDEGFNLADTPSLLLDLDARPRAPVPPPKPAPEALPPPPEPVERCTSKQLRPKGRSFVVALLRAEPLSCFVEVPSGGKNSPQAEPMRSNGFSTLSRH